MAPWQRADRDSQCRLPAAADEETLLIGVLTSIYSDAAPFRLHAGRSTTAREQIC